MATMGYEVPRPNNEKRKPSSSGGGRSGVPSAGGRTKVDDSSPASRTGVWVGMAAITMTFAAFTSAMIVRARLLVRLATLHTAIRLVSRYRLAAGQQPGSGAGPQEGERFCRRSAGAALGGDSLPVDDFGTRACCLSAGQSMAWLKLRSEGLYLATTPSSSFFYLFTVLHALHILGGLAGLDAGDLAVQQAASDVAT